LAEKAARHLARNLSRLNSYLCPVNSLNRPIFHALIGVSGLILDQASKLWAVGRFALPDGTPRMDFVPVWGDLLRLQLDYNEGAAFSIKPQELLPFLPPTLFFALLTLAAMTALVFFYRSLSKEESWARLGVALIMAGALGNLCDRLRIHKVVDFISADFPDAIMQRWPTFNFADCFVCVGVALVILVPMIFRKKVSHEQI
jgi:signal peptidase II